MSEVSREKPTFSSEQEGNENKHVVMYNHIDDVGSLVCVSVDSLIPPETPSDQANLPPLEKSEQELSGEHLNDDMSFICTTSVGGKRGLGPGLYLFGGYRFELGNEYALKNVYRYDLHKLPNIGNFQPCTDMTSEISNSLSVQVGDDCIYVLSYVKTTTDDNGLPKLVVQEYNFEKDKWTLVSDSSDISNKCDGNDWVHRNINRVPHVVIGRKLHVSLGGKSSFTFDTGKHAWEPSNLFETFWTSKKTKESGLSPSDFYGSRVWEKSIAPSGWKRKNFGGGGGKPFGFYGRGILWDKDILLGVHYSTNCPLVAFLLDDKTGRVVKSQTVSLDNYVMDLGVVRDGACLVDLGRDGYFGLVHFLRDDEIDDFDDWGWALLMELVTFKVSRLPTQEIDDDHFLECHLVRKDVVTRNFSEGIGSSYNAFCV